MKAFYQSCFMLVWLATSAFAQTSLVGSVQNEAGKPLPYVSIALLNARDSSFVKGAISKETGVYALDNIRPGQYRLAASAVGYAPVHSVIVSVGASQEKLPTLTMTEIAKTLNEVTVAAQKPLFEQQIDRMVVNVQSSITSTGSTVLDVLERSPGVIVDRQNNTISLNGKDGVMVMINGRLTRLPLDAVMQMLAGMQAGNTDKIELITTPPAKYDAEGNAGLINIVTKRNLDLGTNGSYSANLGYGRYERIGASANINHRTNKVSLFADYSGSLNHYLFFANSDRTITLPLTQRTVTSIERDFRDWAHNGRLGADYQLSSKTTLSALATAFSAQSNQIAHNLSATTQNEKPITDITIEDNELNHSWMYTGNVSARHKFTPTQELSADVDYFYYVNHNPHQYQFRYEYPQESRQRTEWLNNEKRTPIQLWVSRVDYTRAMGKKTNLELGVKATFSHFDNNVQAAERTNGEWIVDSSLSQHVLMSETIKAAYGSLSRQLTPKTKLQVGLRYEHTITDLHTVDNQPLVYRNYGNWFPTVFFSQDFTKQSGVQLSYSRRISRPSFGSLAPFFTILDPTWVITGNDRLLPTLSNNYQTTYRFKKSFLLTLSYAQFTNAITFMVTVSPDQNRQISRYENLDKLTVGSVGLTFPLQVKPWWQMQNNVQGLSQLSRLIQEGIAIDRNQQFFRVNTTQTIKLSSDFTAELTAFYQSRSLIGVTERKPFGMVNIGLQKKLKKEAGVLRLSGEDIFWTLRLQTNLNNVEQGYSVAYNSRATGRLLRLTYSRNFGNQKAKVTRPASRSDEERQRVSY